MKNWAQRGGVEARSALVYGAYPHGHRFARTLCAPPQNAEDAAHKPLIILHPKIDMLRASGALASWMFRIVRKECLRPTRALVSRGQQTTPGRGGPGRHDESGPSDVPGGTARSAEEDALVLLEADRVAAAIAALPAEQRQVLVMRDIPGLPGRTVADRRGLGTAATKSRLHRARLVGGTRALREVSACAGETAVASDPTTTSIDPPGVAVHGTRKRRGFASTSVPRHLARDAVGFGVIVGPPALLPLAGPVSLLLATVGLVALRGRPMCSAIGLVETVPAGRLRRSCTNGSCELRRA